MQTPRFRPLWAFCLVASFLCPAIFASANGVSCLPAAGDRAQLVRIQTSRQSAQGKRVLAARKRDFARRASQVRSRQAHDQAQTRKAQLRVSQLAQAARVQRESARHERAGSQRMGLLPNSPSSRGRLNSQSTSVGDRAPADASRAAQAAARQAIARRYRTEAARKQDLTSRVARFRRALELEGETDWARRLQLLRETRRKSMQDIPKRPL